MKKFDRVFLVARWVVGLLIAGLVFYFGYRLYGWIKTLFTLPTAAAPGKDYTTTLQDYLQAKVPPPSPLDNPTKGISDLMMTDQLTFFDKAFLFIGSYLNSFNPWKKGGILDTPTKPPGK